MLFHGWPHASFVARHAVEFGREFSSDVSFLETVQAAGLSHDYNYLVQMNTGPEVGASIRNELLPRAGFTKTEQENMERIILEASTGVRTATISDQAKALSDADTLFKLLPTTPLIFASRFVIENQISWGEWADTIIAQQIPLLADGLDFTCIQTPQSHICAGLRLTCSLCRTFVNV